MQADILHGRPDNGQAAHLRGEHVDLVGALSHETPQAFDGVGGLKVAMHRLRELIKRQQVLFVLNQASYGLGIALAVFGECSLPVGPLPPVCWVAAKFQRVRPEPQRARVWG